MKDSCRCTVCKKYILLWSIVFNTEYYPFVIRREELTNNIVNASKSPVANCVNAM